MYIHTNIRMYLFHAATTLIFYTPYKIPLTDASQFTKTCHHRSVQGPTLSVAPISQAIASITFSLPTLQNRQLWGWNSTQIQWLPLTAPSYRMLATGFWNRSRCYWVVIMSDPLCKLFVRWNRFGKVHNIGSEIQVKLNEIDLF